MVSVAKGGLSSCRDGGFGVVTKPYSRWIHLDITHFVDICDMYGVAKTARNFTRWVDNGALEGLTSRSTKIPFGAG